MQIKKENGKKLIADIESALSAEVLLKNEHLIPMGGADALDLAC